MIIQDNAAGIFYRSWRVPAPFAVVVLVHGIGGHSARWEFLAQFLQKQGIASYAIELKGFGETKDLPGHIDSFEVYFRDIASLGQIARRQNPGVRVFLLGESLGGLLVFIMSAGTSPLFSGVICIAPAFKIKMYFSVLRKMQVFFALLCCPRKQFMLPLDSAACTRDKEYLASMQVDPREHRLASARLLYATVRAQAGVRRLRPGVPVLFLLPQADTVVDSLASRRVFDKLELLDKTLHEYPGMLHAIPIDTGKEKPFADIAQWVRAHVSEGV